MNISFIPQILKEKIVIFFKYVWAISFLIIAITLTLSIWSFNIDDNSFLTSTNNLNTNLIGPMGSYIASFLIYTFGVLSYFVALYFLTWSISIFLNKFPKYFFIRFLTLFLSLVFLPQSFIYWGWTFEYIDQIYFWGQISKDLFFLYQNEYVSHILTIFGIMILVISINLFSFLRLPTLNMKKMFIQKKETVHKNQNLKKEPIINTVVDSSQAQNITSVTVKNFTKEGELNIKYNSPSLDILDNSSTSLKHQKSKENIQENSELLERVFADFNIEIKVINVKLGPVVTLYEILPAAGIKINTIINLAGDISRSMGVGAVRIAQIFGTQYLGVEVPNDYRETVTIKELLSDESFKNTIHKIPLCVGKDISGNIEVIDLSKTPHLLVAGTTGSGKSVFINTLLTSLLYKFPPEQLRLILIDPKMLELSVYNDIAHLLTPVVTEPKKAIITLKWVCKEMERRYSMMNEEGTRSLEGYNQQAAEKLPYIVVIIDEMADLMMTAGKEVEHYVQRLAQMARACGIHLVMATQRPSVDIITGSIKANFPSRVSFQVASKYDSRTVLGEIGAEQLLGNGDMLMTKNGGNIIRYQSAFISDKEVNKLIKEIKQSQKVEYLQELNEIITNENENFDNLSDEDEALITKSIDLIKNSNKASTSFLQRNFQIGYNKAARIMEALEQRGVVSPPNHTGKRDILINH